MSLEETFDDPEQASPGPKKRPPVWGFYYPPHNQLYNTIGVTYEAAVARARVRWANGHGLNPPDHRQVDPRHFVLVKTNSPEFQEFMGGVCFSKVVTFRIMRRMIELLYGLRLDFASSEEFKSFRRYLAHLDALSVPRPAGLSSYAQHNLRRSSYLDRQR